MGQVIDAEQFAQWLVRTQGAARRLVAIAGPPGVGKSHIVDELVAMLARQGLADVAIVPMDGFHLDDQVLEARGWTARKGAPHTFDVMGLTHTLRRLTADAEDEVFVPLFDRALEISRAGAGVVPRAARLVLVEGNYLLLKAPDWQDLAPLFDVRVMLRAQEAVLRQRLMARWRHFGLDEAAATNKLAENDLPNMAQVLEQSAVADFEIFTDKNSSSGELLSR